MSAATVPLPTAVGPARTTSRERVPVSGVRRSVTRGELALERGHLLGAEAADATALGDPQPFHHLAGAHLAQARHRLEQVDDAHLADDLVLLALAQDVDDGGAGVLEAVLHLGPFPTGGGGLVEGRLALFGGERGQSHVRQVLRSRSGPTGLARAGIGCWVNLVRTSGLSNYWSPSPRGPAVSQRERGLADVAGLLVEPLQRGQRGAAAELAGGRVDARLLLLGQPLRRVVAVVRRGVDAGGGQGLVAGLDPADHLLPLVGDVAGRLALEVLEDVERLDQRVLAAGARDPGQLLLVLLDGGAVVVLGVAAPGGQRQQGEDERHHPEPHRASPASSSLARRAASPRASGSGPARSSSRLELGRTAPAAVPKIRRRSATVP